MIPTVSVEAYRAARTATAFIDRSARGRLLVRGRDRLSFLHGLLTNDIAALKPGEGCYAAYLTAQGRMIADLFVYELGDRLLVITEPDVQRGLLTRLDQLIFTEDVQITDETAAQAEIAIVGPGAAEIVATVAGIHRAVLVGLSEHGSVAGMRAGTPTVTIRSRDTGEDGFELFVDRGQADELRAVLLARGVPELDATTSEALRIEAGLPRFHRDMNEATIPLEAGLEHRAISFTKGCYVGQEVIIRVLHRGHGRVARKLVGLVLEGDRVPADGAIVRVGEAEVGTVTSATRSPALGRPIALASIQRESAEPGSVVEVAGLSATVTLLPFVSAERRWGDGGR